MKARVFCLLFPAVVFLLMGFPNGSTSNAADLRLASEQPPEEGPTRVLEVFIKAVAEKSKGSFKVNLFPNAQLGAERETFEQIRQGTLDIGLISTAPLGTFSPGVSALQLPFLIESWDDAIKVARSGAHMKLLSPLEKMDSKILGVIDCYPRHIASVKPIRKLEDLKGVKIRAAQNPLHVEIFKALGAAPTPLAYGEIYTAMQNKVIDAMDQDFSGVVNMHFYEVASFVTADSHFTWPMVLVMSSKRWNSLSKEDQKIFLDAASLWVEEFMAQGKKEEVELVKVLKEKKVEIIYLSPEERAKWKTAVKPVIEKHTQDPLVAEFVAAVEQAKKK